MRQLRPLLAASFLIGCLLTVIANAQEQALQVGTPIERQLGSGQTFTFTITLEESQFVQLVVDQRGVDVVVRVASPAGKSLGDFDSPNGDNGPENVSFVATAAGVYRVTVAPLNQENNGANGKFEIKVVELRQATEQEIKTNKNLEVVKAKGIALLGDVEGLIPELHSPQSRIRAQLQAAQMLWKIDEKRASKYMSDAMASVKEFMATVDTGSQEYSRAYSQITQVRWEILRILASRDPEAALNFLYSSKPPVNPYGNDREADDQERAMEISIANEIIAKDPKRGFQIARQNLKRGYSSDIINTISTLRQKNPELAIELATEVANKLLGDKLLKSQQAAGLTVNLISGCNAQRARSDQQTRVVAPGQPLLPEQTCRDLAQKALQEALSFQLPPRNAYTPERDAAWSLLNGLRSVGWDLDATSEGGAAAVEKKLTELNNASNPYQETFQQFQTKIDAGATDGAAESIQKAPKEIREQLYNQLANALAIKGEGARARQIINDHVTNPFQRRQALANLAQQEMYQQIQQGKVDEALRLIAALKTPRERASMLVQIVQQIGPGQKRASALNSLEQARSLLAPELQAQDQEQMYALVALARAFSRYDSRRAFEMLDPLVDQLNDLCAAAHTLDGFGGQFYQDDELDLQNGNNIANLAVQLSGTLGALAVTNFERAKLTSDRLRLPELRLRAYLDIAQQTIEGAK
jgi:hypothetical protein